MRSAIRTHDEVSGQTRDTRSMRDTLRCIAQRYAAARAQDARHCYETYIARGVEIARHDAVAYQSESAEHYRLARHGWSK
jgi:hypothetical protein